MLLASHLALSYVRKQNALIETCGLLNIAFFDSKLLAALDFHFELMSGSCFFFFPPII